MCNASDFQVENGVLKKYIGTNETVVLPETISSVEIGAISGNIKHIVFPEGTTRIPDYVCYCLSSLETLTLPEGVTHIGANAFESCLNLREVHLPDSLLEIGFAAFADCEKLKSVRLQKGLRKVKRHAFWQCKRLEEIALPDTVTEIDSGAFGGCCMLTNLIIPAGIKKIGDDAFNGCRLISAIQIPNTITKLESGTFAGCKNLRSVTLPAELNKIGTACFGSCESLEDIKIPSTVKTIEDRAFSGCTTLKEVLLPEGIEFVGEKAFTGCAKTLVLRCSGAVFAMFAKETKDNITMSWLTGTAEYSKDETDAIKKYAGRALQRLFTEIEGDDEEALARLLTCGKVKPENLESYINKCNDGKHPKMMMVLLNHKNKTVSPAKKEEIADKVTGMAERTAKDWAKFYRWVEDADGLVISKYKGIDAEVEIPDQIDGKPVVRIGKNAFKNNAQIQFVRMPNSITEVLESAFEKCTSLKEVLWSENLRVIEKRAFYGCTSLNGALNLPQALKSLGVNAFSGCNFTEINLHNGLEAIADGALACGNYTELHIPESVKKLGFCTGYFDGDLYIHGMKTKLNDSAYYGMPLTLHAPAGSFAAKCAEAGVFKNYVVL